MAPRSLPPTWQPLLREAGIASQSLATGLAWLYKANHAQHAFYNQAFFGLSIGFERLLKLIILLDYALDHAGKYPTTAVFRDTYGNDLQRLFAVAREIRERRSGEGFKWDLVEADVAERIIKVLSEFAQSTRYYNLDYLTGAPSVASRRDPLAAWFTEVGSVLTQGYPVARRRTDEISAEMMHKALDDISAVLHSAEDGRPLTNIRDLARHEALVTYIQRQATFHCAALVRYLAEILTVLNRHSRPGGVIEVPFLYEFFTVFNNNDAYLKGRRTFT